MNNALPQYSPQVLSSLAETCAALAKGDYGRAKELFALTAGQQNSPVIAELAEAFGFMLVKVEAREFHLEKLAEDLEVAYKEQSQLQKTLAKENKQLRENLRKDTAQQRIVGTSPVMREIMSQAERIAQVDATVLITGETGTGKGMLARTLHDDGARAAGPFVAINCAAIPSTLLESELFGIEKGVASGVTARMGRFEQADGGSIFLDEIGDMPLESQAKILHVIENRCVERIGGRKSIPVNVRIIAATHRDLAAMCEEKLFRSDLYYRLNVIRLHVPALRERPEDIPGLVRYFLERCGRRNPGAVSGITKEAMRRMMAHTWPGNIRELENETERAALLAQGSSITPQDLSSILSSLAPQPMQADAPELLHPSRKPVKKKGTPGNASASLVAQAAPVRALVDMEAEIVRRALAQTGGNKSQTARLLGISREGLRKMLKRLNIS
ncbi:MAG: sigma-54 dependent transcriptional regulator [Deltaproteobacteria bacterium]|jgi:DNA-binding NtrC family response regulator|nr:sigma-54 dependent transcriptional regulator [Deltaproteobacteria bacterium]